MPRRCNVSVDVLLWDYTVFAIFGTLAKSVTFYYSKDYLTIYKIQCVKSQGLITYILHCRDAKDKSNYPRLCITHKS